MDFEIVWAEPASDSLEHILRPIDEDNPDAAAALRSEIINVVLGLRQLPYKGAVYERDETRQIRELICRRYRIFYRVMEAANQVEVLLVWHGSRREPRLPR